MLAASSPPPLRTCSAALSDSSTSGWSSHTAECQRCCSRGTFEGGICATSAGADACVSRLLRSAVKTVSAYRVPTLVYRTSCQAALRALQSSIWKSSELERCPLEKATLAALSQSVVTTVRAPVASSMCHVIVQSSNIALYKGSAEPISVDHRESSSVHFYWPR